MFTILPLTVWIRVAQPTEQNGQMLGVVLAPVIRSSCARAAAGARVTPNPTIPPIAVPAPALAVSRTKSRRLTCMRSSPLRSGVACAKPVGRDDIRIAFGGRNPGGWRHLGCGHRVRCAGRTGTWTDAGAAGADACVLRDPRGTGAA